MDRVAFAKKAWAVLAAISEGTDYEVTSVEFVEKVQAIIKPFAGFADFDACVAAQKKAGHSDESAHKICGALQRDAEKAEKNV